MPLGKTLMQKLGDEADSRGLHLGLSAHGGELRTLYVQDPKAKKTLHSVMVDGDCERAAGKLLRRMEAQAA